MFTVPVGMPFGGLGEHEPLTIPLFLPIVPRRNWKGPWIIRVNEWGCGAVRAIKLECKR